MPLFKDFSPSGFKKVGKVWQGSCPQCGSSDAFTHWPETNGWHCFSCSYHPKPREAINFEVPKISPKKGEKEARARANPNILHEVYTELLKNLSLSQEHREHLLYKRHLPVSEIARRNYKTLPRKGRTRITKRLLKRFGIELLSQVPGFYLGNDGRGNQYPSIAGPSGILLPVRDVVGRIVALQVKADNASTGKYKWCSSSGKLCGTSSGSPAHISRPDKRTSGTLYITEGVLKADIASNLLNADVISVSGVGNWRSGNVVEMAKELKPEVVVMAYDADAETNQSVRRQRASLCNALQTLGVSVFIAKWDIGQGKGLDDLLLNSGKPNLEPRKRKGKRFQTIPSELSKEMAEPQYLSLGEARGTLYRKMRELLAKAKPGMNFISSSIGSGKTRAALQAVHDLHQKGEWPLVWRTKKGRKEARPARVLFVTDTKAAYEQWLPTFKDLAEVREGRSPDPSSKWHCHEYASACRLGENRHSPHWDLCSSCKENHGEGWFCPYLVSIEKTKGAKVVFAPKDSFFNHSSELKTFDIVIVDEDLVNPLVEKSTLTLNQLEHYLQGMAKIRERDAQAYPSYDPFVKMVHLLKSLISKSEDKGQNWTQAIPKLREVAEGEGANLEELVEALNRNPPNRRTKRYPFEKPYYSKEEWIVPVRFLWDLITSLKAEIKGRADTRLWLAPEGLRLFLPRQHIIDLLKGKGRRRGKCVINLDATPSPLLDYMFPGAEKLKVEVKERMEVTQVTDGLYPEATLRSRNSLDNVSRAVGKAIEGSRLPVVFTHKSFDPQVEDGNPKLNPMHPNARFGHFDRETRALNGYADADCMAVTGHYCHPLNEIKAMAQAVRFEERSKAPGLRSQEGLRQYQFKSPEGTGAGFWHKNFPDPLVQECISHCEESAIKQAIGRGRPALRDEKNPLKVFLFTALPVKGLPISQLTTISKILSEGKTSVEFEAGRTMINAQRKIEAKEKIERAAKELGQKGEEPSIRKIHELTGCSFSTIEKVIPELDSPPVTHWMQYINNNLNQCVTPPLPSPEAQPLTDGDSVKGKALPTNETWEELLEEAIRLWKRRGKPWVLTNMFGVVKDPTKPVFSLPEIQDYLRCLKAPPANGTREELLKEAITLWEQKGKPWVLTNMFGLVRDPTKPVFSLPEIRDYLRCLKAQHGQ